jgi:dipeptidyl aminopeptidase/acylaminoacyl peptidase
VFVLISLTLMMVSPATADEPTAGIDQRLQQLESTVAGFEHRFDELAKQIDDLLWFDRLGDVAVVDKVRIYGPPAASEPNPTGIGAGNHVKFYAYLFTPRTDFGGQKLPLLVLPHGGVHADFTTYHTHIVRELIAQGYIVAAPDYRGSTGYGEGLWKRIDYGGREVEDVLAARDWVVANHPRVDPGRVGLIGWSHGGLITLMSLFDHPEAYVCGFAGVPVSDLVMRLGYSDPSYRALFEADYHIGQSVGENLEEYKRRSPAWQVDRLTRPLRIHTNPHDEDVNFIEVERLVQALTAAGKDFEYQVYDVPGGHSHDRLDTPEAWQARRDIYAFLARYLKPPNSKISLGISKAGIAAP